MSKSRQERDYSDRIYAHGRESERSSKRFMRNLVPLSPPLHILDVGCGTGLNAEKLASLGHSLTGIDISPIAIEEFQARGFKGLVADLSEPLDFSDGSFDLAYASEVIEHLADTNAFLCELKRVVRPGGRILLSLPNSAFWAYRLMAVLGRAPSEVQHPGHIRFFSLASLNRALETAGLSVESIAGRHTLAILPGWLGDMAPRWLEALNFEREFRFATGTHFWTRNYFAPKASGFWADTLIALIRTPEAA